MNTNESTKREPSEVAILSARIQRAYPSLSPYSAASLAHELCSIERAQRRHAERCCSGEDGGYVRRRSLAREDDCAGSPCVIEHDPDAEQRAGARIARSVGRWRDSLCHFATAGHFKQNCIAHMEAQAAINDGARIVIQNDPRGRVLLLQLPGESEPS